MLFIYQDIREILIIKLKTTEYAARCHVVLFDSKYKCAETTEFSGKCQILLIKEKTNILQGEVMLEVL